MKRHVFVIACTPRSGSTLMQRLLMSHPELFMWGEGRHLLGTLLKFYEEYNNKNNLFKHSWDAANKDGFIKGWYPNLMPNMPIKELVAGWASELMGRHPDFKNWGCKFVLITPKQVGLLHAIFPVAGYIFLSREWPEIRKSLEACRHWWPGLNMRDIQLRWQAMMKFFRRPGFDALTVKYEDLCNNPKASVERIEKHLEMELRSLDMTVFEHKIGSVSWLAGRHDGN